MLSLSASSINQVSAISADSTSGRWTLSYGRGAHVYINKGGGGRHSVSKGEAMAPLCPPPGDDLDVYLLTVGTAKRSGRRCGDRYWATTS